MTTTHPTETPTVPAIGRCKTKGCKYALRYDAPAVVSEVGDRFGNVRRVTSVNYYAELPQCPEHPNEHGLLVKAIKGTFSPVVKCDWRCHAAKGETCECACGGANHGSDHAA